MHRRGRQPGNGVALGVSRPLRFSERGRQTRKEHHDSRNNTAPTPYENRLKLVQDTMTMYSVLDDDAASKLAVHVLDALDSIPEKIR